MIIFGGFEDGERTNSTVIFHFNRNLVWSRVKTEETDRMPEPRSGHGATVYKGTMFVFGGKTENNRKLNDLWAFNISSNSWSEVELTDDICPTVRSGHTLVTYGDQLLLFGGIYEVTKELNDIYAFVPSLRRWVAL
jgi:N-acetylneuraminic acid mutarotase